MSGLFLDERVGRWWVAARSGPWTPALTHARPLLESRVRERNSVWACIRLVTTQTMSSYAQSWQQDRVGSIAASKEHTQDPKRPKAYHSQVRSLFVLGASGWLSQLTPVIVSGSWVQAPHWSLCSVWSLLGSLCLSLPRPLPLSLLVISQINTSSKKSLFLCFCFLGRLWIKTLGNRS